MKVLFIFRYKNPVVKNLNHNKITSPSQKGKMTKEIRRLRILDFLIRDDLYDALYLVSSDHRKTVSICINEAIDRLKSYSSSTISINGDFDTIIKELEEIKAKSLDDAITDDQLKFLIICTYVEMG